VIGSARVLDAYGPATEHRHPNAEYLPGAHVPVSFFGASE
jgi:hypothetical protein